MGDHEIFTVRVMTGMVSEDLPLLTTKMQLEVGSRVFLGTFVLFFSKDTHTSVQR